VARAEACLHAKFHLDPSNRLATVHERYRQDRQWTDSIGRTILQTVTQKLSAGILQSSMYSLKPLEHINTNAQLSSKIEVKKMGLEMMLEFRDVCNVPNVSWQRVPNRWTSH